MHRVAILLAALPLCVFGADWSREIKPVSVARLPSYTEGVVVDLAGNLFVSHADRISRVTPDGEVSLWSELPSPNGHKILPDGRHLVCDRKGAVYLLEVDGTVVKKAVSPPFGANDICLDPASDGFYFTSPYESRTEPRGQLYYVDREENLHLVADWLGYANGVVLRPDGKTLLVDESLFNRILEFPVLSPGKLGPARVFADLPKPGSGQPAAKTDGIALDEDGNLYVAHYGMGAVQVLDTEGRLLASLRGAGVFTSNVAFARPDRNQLYVTGSIGPTEQTEGLLLRFDLPGVRGVVAHASLIPVPSQPPDSDGVRAISNSDQR